MLSMIPNRFSFRMLCAFTCIAGALTLPASLLNAQTAASGAGIGPSLGSLPNLTPDTESRMISPENPTGGKGMGAMAVPSSSNPFSAPAAHLGQGWKVRPFINVPAHSTVTIMDVAGPGTIEHIWMASSPKFRGNGRATALRFYWDGETSPSVEVPLTDFFAIGNDRFAPVNSLAVIDVPTASMNCYWPMPFRKHAKITVTNDSDKILPLFTYQIDYRVSPVSQASMMGSPSHSTSITDNGESGASTGSPFSCSEKGSS